VATHTTRRSSTTPNGSVDGDIALLLERVCAGLPHDYTRQLVRDVVRMKLELGLDRDVRDYLKRRSGDFPAISSHPRPARGS
jgi:hypothetical protein